MEQNIPLKWHNPNFNAVNVEEKSILRAVGKSGDGFSLSSIHITLFLSKSFCFFDSQCQFLDELFVTTIWGQVYSIETSMTSG